MKKGFPCHYLKVVILHFFYSEFMAFAFSMK